MNKSRGGDGVETGTCIYGGIELWLLAAELSIGVMCTRVDAQAIEQVARV